MTENSGVPASPALLGRRPETNDSGDNGLELSTVGTRCGASDRSGNASVCTTSEATRAITSVVTVPTTRPRSGRIPSGWVVSAVSS